MQPTRGSGVTQRTGALLVPKSVDEDLYTHTSNLHRVCHSTYSKSGSVLCLKGFGIIVAPAGLQLHP